MNLQDQIGLRVQETLIKRLALTVESLASNYIGKARNDHQLDDEGVEDEGRLVARVRIEFGDHQLLWLVLEASFSNEIEDVVSDYEVFNLCEDPGVIRLKVEGLLDLVAKRAREELDRQTVLPSA